MDPDDFSRALTGDGDFSSLYLAHLLDVDVQWLVAGRAPAGD